MCNKIEESFQNKTNDEEVSPSCEQQIQQEFGGVEGPEPTRFGDWEKNGRCIDF